MRRPPGGAGIGSRAVAATDLGVWRRRVSKSFDSIQSLLKQVHSESDGMPQIESPEETAEKARIEAEKRLAALQKFREDCLTNREVVRRLKRFRREGVYAIRPWQWAAILIGTPLIIFLAGYFLHLFSSVTRSNVAIFEGTRLIYSGKPDEGYPRLLKALDLGADPAKTLLRFGTAFMDMDASDSAAWCLDRAVAEARTANDVSTVATATVRLGELYLATMRPDQALQCANSVLAIDIKHRDALILMGRVYLAQSRLDDAEAAFINSIERNPNSLMPRHYLRETYSRTGDRKKTREQEEFLRLARPAGDEDIPTLVTHAGLLVSSGRLNEAEAVLLSILRMQQRPRPDILVSLGHLALEKEDIGGARTYADSAVEALPTMTDALVLKSEIAYYEGRVKEAITTLRSVLALDPLHPRAQYDIGCIMLYDLGLYPQALAAFRGAVATGFSGTFLWYNIGVCEYLLRRPEAALEAFTRMPDFVAKNADARWTIANAALLDRQTDTALAIYTELRLAREKDPALENNIGVAQELRGESIAALGRYWSAIRMSPTPATADTVAAANIDRMMRGRPASDPWQAMHSEVPLRLRGVLRQGRNRRAS
jgi:tetratricopeptide (TPR) repeat protein